VVISSRRTGSWHGDAPRRARVPRCPGIRIGPPTVPLRPIFHTGPGRPCSARLFRPERIGPRRPAADLRFPPVTIRRERICGTRQVRGSPAGAILPAARPSEGNANGWSQGGSKGGASLTAPPSVLTQRHVRRGVRTCVGDRTAFEGLLESPDASLRWKAKVEVLGESRDSRSLRRLEEEVARSPRVRSLLQVRGWLERPGRGSAVYHKWLGVQWVLASLADLGYPKGDERLRPLVDLALRCWTAPHYFTDVECDSSGRANRARGVPLIAGRSRRCASQQGNALHFATALGLTDERCNHIVERLLHWQWPDGGWNCDQARGADTSSFHETWLPTLGLWEYGTIAGRTDAELAARRASEVFLCRRLFRGQATGQVIRPDFVRLHYPHYWHYDVLAGLKVMSRLGLLGDRRCVDGLDLLEAKRLPDGGWPAEARYYARTDGRNGVYAERTNWGGTSVRDSNPWITAEALAILRQAGWWTAYIVDRGTHPERNLGRLPVPRILSERRAWPTARANDGPTETTPCGRFSQIFTGLSPLPGTSRRLRPGLWSESVVEFPMTRVQQGINIRPSSCRAGVDPSGPGRSASRGG